MKKKLLVLMMALLGTALSVLGQARQISGTVTGEDGLPVQGVTVVVLNTNVGVITDMGGNYNLAAEEGATLKFSFLGMVSQEINIGTRTSVDVELVSISEQVGDVIVVAYGTAKKESFTGSVEMIQPKDISKRNVASVTKALDGTIAGVTTTSGGGQPGSDAKIRIRGTGSMNASNDPLYVVDGIPYDGMINAINPSDIESISVLKDASSAALYGARGANGVVIITTKQGKEGKSRVSFKADWGFSNRAVEKYRTVNSAEYLEIYHGMFGDNYMGYLGGEQYNPYNISSDKLMQDGKVRPDAELRWNEDWLKEGERTAFRQEYVLGVSGGSKTTQYYVSLGYLDEEGTAKTTAFDRFTLNTKIDTQATSWMKLGASLMASKTKSNYMFDSGGTAYTNLWYTAISAGPIFPVYKKDENGNTIYKDDKKVFDYGAGRPFGRETNAVGALYNDPRIDRMDNLSGRTYMTFATDKDIPFLKDLSATLSVGFNYYNRNVSTIYSADYGQFVDQGGYSNKYNYRNFSYTFNQIVNYNKKLGLHSFDVMLGHEYYDLKHNRMSGEKSGSAGIPGNIEFPAYAQIEDLTSREDVYRVESYFSRVNYNFDNRYYFSASLRTDGSSRFKDNRWGTFWSVGASWRLSEESFMKDVKWLDNLTLKASFGIQGNDNLAQTVAGVLDNRYYAYQGMMDLDYSNASTGGVVPTTVANSAIKWEKNKNLNIGIESTMFNSRLRLTAEFYIKKTSDLLMNRPIASSLGYSYYLDNVGAMKNTGFDLTIAGTPVRTNDFMWDVTFIASHWKNKVTSLYGGLDNLSPTATYITKVGEALNAFYPVLAANVNPETGAARYKYYKTDKDGNYVYDDTTGKIVEVITENYNEASQNRTDKNLKGSRVPDIMGSITNGFQYKGFDLSFMFNFSIGGKIIESNYSSLFNLASMGGNLHKDLYNRRWKEVGDVTKVPKPNSKASHYTTDYFLKDASYLAFQNFTVGYTFDQHFMKKAGINSIRVSVTGNNLYTWTKLKGMDPQYNFAGQVDYKYTPIRNISFGLELNF